MTISRNSTGGRLGRGGSSKDAGTAPDTKLPRGMQAFLPAESVRAGSCWRRTEWFHDRLRKQHIKMESGQSQ